MMPDREKAVNIYANCILNDKQCCSECYTGGPGLGIACRQKVLTDVFYLLKGQDPVPAELEGGGSSWWWVCGECHGQISKGDRYCRHCGHEIKWE